MLLFLKNLSHDSRLLWGVMNQRRRSNIRLKWIGSDGNRSVRYPVAKEKVCVRCWTSTGAALVDPGIMPASVSQNMGREKADTYLVTVLCKHLFDI